MYKLINKVFFLASLTVFIFTATQIKAQDGLDFDEVQVIAPYEPAISDAFKIHHSPIIKDTLQIDRDLAYNIQPLKLQTRFEVEPINAARMRGEPITELYKGYIKGGFGTHATPYGEVFYNSLRSNEYAGGLRLKHLSSNGIGDDHPHTSGYSDNLAKFYGKRYFGNHTLEGGLDYERNMIHFYGIGVDENDLDNDTVNFDQLTDPDELKQSYNYFSANTGFRNISADSAEISYDFDLEYHYLMDDYDASEHNIDFSSTLQWQISSDKNEDEDTHDFSEKQHFKIEGLANYYKNQSPLDSVSSSIFGIKPKLYSSFRDFDFYIGANLALYSDTAIKGGIHPIAGTEVNLVDGALVAYGYLTGGIKRHNLYDFYRRNPFITSELEYRFMNKKSEIGGGFRGSFSSYVSYDVSVSSSIIENYAFFVTDHNTLLNNKLKAIYDDVRLFNFRTEIYSQISDNLNARFISNYYQYTLDNEMEPWHKPSIKLNLAVKYNIQDKIIITADGFARNSVYGRIFDEEGDPFAEEIYGFHVDANLGIEYRYTKLLSVFLNFNNIQNQPLERWINYPSQKFNFIGGVNYSF